MHVRSLQTKRRKLASSRNKYMHRFYVFLKVRKSGCNIFHRKWRWYKLVKPFLTCSCRRKFCTCGLRRIAANARFCYREVYVTCRLSRLYHDAETLDEREREREKREKKGACIRARCTIEELAAWPGLCAREMQQGWQLVIAHAREPRNRPDPKFYTRVCRYSFMCIYICVQIHAFGRRRGDIGLWRGYKVHAKVQPHTWQLLVTIYMTSQKLSLKTRA